jgi:hypothetical protein
MHKIKLVIFLLWTANCFAQGGGNALQVKMPTIVPPGPEAASIIKAGNLSVNMQNGAATASIPFAELKCGSLSLPVSFSYATNGTKVDEIPSRVGLNWSINAGGVITRTTMDDPDDQSTNLTEPANILAQTPEVLTYLKAVTNENGAFDAQPDEYRYNINGLSGKFIIKNNIAIQIPKTKVKITTISGMYGFDKFVITGTDGTKYYFGGSDATEISKTYNLAGQMPTKPRIKTSWFIERIVSLSGDEIYFSYSNIPIKTEPGISMTATKPDLTNYDICAGENWPDNSVNASSTLQRVDYDSPLLLSISSNKGNSINFSYENRPDFSDDKRLLTVSYVDNGNMISTYNLEYDYYTNYQSVGANQYNNTYLNHRYFLKKINSISPSDPPLTYEFEYNDPEQLPHRLSYAQDYYGFFNGQGNQSLFPTGVMPSYTSWMGILLPGNRNSFPEYAKKGTLKKIIYPTGGTEEFEYEGLSGFCGLRVFKIKSYDPVTQKTFSKYYTYSGLVSGVNPEFLTKTKNYKFCGGLLLVPQTSFVLHTNSLTPSHLYDGSQLAFTNVKISDDINNVNGYTEHKFENWYFNGTSVLWGENILSAPLSNLSTANGDEIETNIYNGNNQLVKKVVNNYITDTRLSELNLIKFYNKKYDYPYASNPPQSPEFEAFDINEYLFHSEWVHLDNTVETEYDNFGIAKSTTTNYVYDNLVNLQPTEINTTNSKGETIKVLKKYPNDLVNETYPAGEHPYTAMVVANNLNTVIEEKTYNMTDQLLYTRNEMKKSNGTVVPDYMNLKKDNNPTETRLRYYAYDVENNPLELSKENDIHISYIWDYNKQLPIAEAINAAWNDIAYTSFEADGTGNWSVIGNGTGAVGNGDPTVLNAFTGNSAYDLSTGDIVNLTFNPSKQLTYMIQYWEKTGTDACKVNDNFGTVLMTKNGWNLMQHKLVDPSLIKLNGGSIIDELRMYPINSQIKTMTYKQGIGLQTINDDRANINFYEYDGFKRLLRIRDLDRNVLKQMEYRYLQDINPCTNTAANWVNTNNLRCVVDPATGNFTNAQEYEQRDMNNCSASYWQTRWMPNGNSASCIPIVCTGINKRVVNGVCESGSYHYVGSLIKPGGWMCTFYYTWSDGYTGPTLTTMNNPYCGDTPPNPN